MLARTRLFSSITSKASVTQWHGAIPIVATINSRASFHSTASRQELSPEHKKIVKSTAPVLAEHGVTITTHFYKRLLEKHPELKNIFNSAHQSTGAQPAALAHAVWAYAENIDNLGALTTAVSRIGNKHASLGIAPEHYPLVGDNLLLSIKEVLGDAVNQQVIDAWAAAYNQLADIFINFERGLYKAAEQTPGGWTGWRKFKITRKVHESDEIDSFYLEPTDGKQLPPFKSGQYVSVRVFVPELGVYQPRQYSLSDIPDGKHFRISVKKESARGVAPAGRISKVLHENVPEGAEIDVSNPYGDFTLDIDSDTPAVLISGGVGITPMLSMLGALVNHAPTRQVVFVHATRNGKVHAMKDFLSRIIQQNSQVSRAIFYEEVEESEEEGKDFDYKGRIDLEKIKEMINLPRADYYLCGPIPFMSAQRKGLEAMGVDTERIHSEVFGAGVA